jgi:tRNA nucleotidyltransferase/poly(A) polymerase
MEMYEVGGCVRDEILGTPSKDIDFTVVLSEADMGGHRTKKGDLRDPFDVMELELLRRGFKIHVRKKEFLTIRGKFPGSRNRALQVNGDRAGLDADFVLARREGTYTDGRRPDEVFVGTLMDDLRRRDFTMNAIAKDMEGNIIDPFGGRKAIEERRISAVGDPMERFTEDALRAVRALRFSVTKGFRIDGDVQRAMESMSVLTAIRDNISAERIKDEVNKMFAYDTLLTLRAFDRFPSLTSAMFAGGRVRMQATMKEKIR